MLFTVDRFTTTRWEEEILQQYPATVATGYFLIQISSILYQVSRDGRALLARVFDALASAIEKDAQDVATSFLTAPELILVASTASASRDMAVRLRAISTNGRAGVSLDKDAQNALTAFEAVDPARDQTYTFDTVRAAVNLVYGITIG